MNGQGQTASVPEPNVIARELTVAPIHGLGGDLRPNVAVPAVTRGDAGASCAPWYLISAQTEDVTRETGAGTLSGQPRTVHVPCTVEQDEDGIWCAPAWLGSSGGANGNGSSAEEAVADLREAVQLVIDEDGVPEQLARTMDL